MKNTLKILAVVLVVALLAAFTLAATGCTKEASTSDDTTTTTDTTDDTTDDAADDAVAGDATAGETEIAGACVECHDLTRIYLQTDYPDWNGLITRMEEEHGAVLTDQEKADIEAFLESRTVSAAESLIQGKCTNCHDLTRLYEQPVGTDWENVIATMVDVHGAELTAEEQQQVADYLDNLRN